MIDHSSVSRADEQARTYDWSIFVSLDGETWTRVTHGLSFHVCSEELRHFRLNDSRSYLRARREP